MRDPCDTCAFRETSCTFRDEPYNRLRALVAALAGLPFFCHHDLNWRGEMGIYRGKAFDMDGAVADARVCAGWQGEVKRLADLGHFKLSKEDRVEQKWWGGYALKLIDAFCDKDAAEEDKEEYMLEIKAILISLTGGGVRISDSTPIQDIPYASPRQ